jgi:lysophospholipase L1-like esterase
MKKLNLNNILIPFLIILMSVFISCQQEINQKDILWTIPYSKNNLIGSNKNLAENKTNKIQLYADQFGQNPEKSDLSAEVNFSWSSEGLSIFSRITDDIFIADTASPSKSDAIEIILAPFRGSNDIIQITVLPCNTTTLSKAEVIFRNSRSTGKIREIPIDAFAYSRRKENITYYEILLPLNGLGLASSLNTRLAMQVYVNDVDIANGNQENQLQWYPIGNSGDNSLAMYDLIFVKRSKFFLNETSKCYIIDNERINITIYSNTFRRSSVRIVKNTNILFSSDTSRIFPFTFNFPLGKINPDKDTIRVFFNDEPLAIHDLFNVPRLYKKINPPGGFEREIRLFEAQDRISPPPENAILFIGSSSIKGWRSLKDNFPENDIIQRGFGGSTSADALFYVNRIVLPYKPSKIFYYEGDNDIPKGLSEERIISEIDSFIMIVHENIPDTKIYILTPKPSYARFKLWPRYIMLNAAIKNLCNQYPFVSYVDVGTPMFDEKGILRKDIFVKDSLHMNENGYRIWSQIIRKELDTQ